MILKLLFWDKKRLNNVVIRIISVNAQQIYIFLQDGLAADAEGALQPDPSLFLGQLFLSYLYCHCD